mmetsp:Transcript_14966/g.26212  ORF Transcript_14966/g.26212 Transcript_14966/m.26212 type:complete len:413 (+) Transcript_14966:49-1287(+)|eukprot:CAMPEP_0197642322 /NCGR_PEP_ID=MMETSP1338-20131121/16015_1 /TAXON_ID=43686 ORGANISM="Pelagodinium beii, Strain RCC1491" /NCGR_SAMPLE_ID=MMETSP1338 /ASSEMBLY_ACC=CAM_ASM_000754 /LENGTH=412 /DNA_ID=CAMNT_0043215429 /DNA_START=49 /DNA_END=1287 /DNA_ORIENTATION=-
MIRLYPQVVQREKDIQELREQLQMRQSENQAQVSKMLESAVQRQELHLQLLSSEEEQDRLLSEHKVECDKTVGLQNVMDSALEVRDSLLAQLERSREEHSAGLKDLAHAESESQKCWASEQRISSRSAELAQRLSLQSSNLEELQKRVQKSLAAHTRLQGEWEDAVALATVERGQVREMTSQMRELWTVAASHESAASDLSEKICHTEMGTAQLCDDIMNVEGQDTRRDDLRSELREGMQEEEDLKMKLQEKKAAERELDGVETKTYQEREVAKKKLQNHSRRWQLLRQSLKLTTDRSQKVQDVIFKQVRRCSEISHRQNKVEQHGAGKIADLEKSLADFKDEATSLETDHKRFEAETLEVQRNLSQTDAQKEELVATLAKREEVHAELLVKKADLEAEVEVLKKQFRCVIS